MIKITDTMVLALLKKGMTYEIDECGVETEIPMPSFSMEENAEPLKMKLSMTIKNFKMQISQD